MEVPITGVVGVLGGSAAEVRDQLDALHGPPGVRPDAVEIRADLLEDPREAAGLLEGLPAGVRALFTVRLPGHGGRFHGTEAERLDLYRGALARGAAMVDAEWDSQAARDLAATGAPLVVSHHDFLRPLRRDALDALARSMAGLGPRVIKIVSTAEKPADGLEMLRWVGGATRGGPARVGFAMGTAGLPSRVLCVSRGSPWTYGALGKAVAPGMPSVRALKELYRVDLLGPATTLLGTVGRAPARSLMATLFNGAFAARGLEIVALPLDVADPAELRALLEALPLAGLSVAAPFEEAALELADDVEPQARAAGMADTLLVPADRRQGAGRGARRRLMATKVDPPETTGLLRALPDCGREGAEESILLARAVVQLERFAGVVADEVELRRYRDAWGRTGQE